LMLAVPVVPPLSSSCVVDSSSSASAAPPPLPSFPTRRSSDLLVSGSRHEVRLHAPLGADEQELRLRRGHRYASGNGQRGIYVARDRKSTRLNSSHVSISYAVFCLKKKKKTARPGLSEELRQRY